MDNVTYIFQIYKSCDPKNTNSVPVSSLLNFIKPFISDDLSELAKLQAELDPDGSDPSISSGVFFRVMSDWIAKIDREGCCGGFSEMANNNEGSREETGLVLPDSGTSTLEMSQNNISEIFNTSNINNNSIVFEEQIQKLQHQLHKTLKDLELVKQELASSEEQNEALSTELSNIKKLHHRVQQLNEENARSKQENEEIKVEASLANKKMQELAKTVSNYEKQNQNLLTQNGQLEDEIGLLKDKIEKMEEHRLEIRSSVTQLEGALDDKESEITSLLKIIDDLKSELNEKEDLVNFYVNENKLSKQKVETLENQFNDMFIARESSCNGNCKFFTSSPKDQGNNSADLFPSPSVVTILRSPHKTLKEELAEISSIHKFDDNAVKRLEEVFKQQEQPNTSSDLFPGVVTVLRSPHKSLKEELAEISSYKFEVKRLQEVLKEQENIKKNMWEGMKRLSQDNEILQCLMNTNTTKEDKSTLTENEKQIPKEHKSTETEKQIPREHKSTETEGDKRQKVIECLEAEIKLLQNSLEKQKTLSKEMIDKCTETEKDSVIWTIPISTNPDSKKPTYSKQEIKLEKLLQKFEKIQSELTTERAHNRVLVLQVGELSGENIKIKENLEFFQVNYNTVLQNVEALERERERLRQEIFKLTNEKFQIAQEYQNSLDMVAVEKSITHGLQTENEFLANKIQQLEISTKQDSIKENFFKQHVGVLKKKYNIQILLLKKHLTEKDNKILLLQKQNAFIERFLSEINGQLSNTNLQIDDIITDTSLIVEDVFENELENSSLKEQLDALSRNIKFVLHLLKNVNNESCVTSNQKADKLRNGTHNVSSSISSSSEEEMYTSVSFVEDDESSIILDEFINNASFEMTPFETDSFLDNLELNGGNLKNLSRQEMENKFTTFALILTMDCATLNKRHFDQKEKCDRLFRQFWKYLYNVVALIRRHKLISESEVDKILSLLKNSSEEVFKSAFQSGVLQYEKRTINCWNLVINYVAILSQESKPVKSQASVGSLNIINKWTPIPLQHQIKYIFKSAFTRSESWKSFKNWIVICFFILFILFVFLILYVDSVCVKHGKQQVCPVEWLLSFLVKRVHSHQLL